MSTSCCLLQALTIAQSDDTTWGTQLNALPTVCPTPERCRGGRNCRENVADYLRMQYRMKRIRANTKEKRKRREQHG